ncbi:hypothetical protein [Saccharothrix deserti]|uniref:hypothetical protein n=1 Tax=Saccharothrix deserti TaxID=2593674 RepID=UPI00131CCCD7|nr:hypothetical protein [Saccharothrix deserti]
MGGSVWRLVTAGVAGAVVLAFVGSPQSLGMLFVVGPDSPAHIGAQLVIALCGAGAMAVAVLLDRYWRWLVAAGAAGVVLATVLHAPEYRGLTATAVGSGQDPATQGLSIPVAVGCLVAGAAGVLVIGLFGVVREVARSSRAGGALAGFVAVAAYYGVAVIGPARSAAATPRVLIVAVAAAVAITAVVLGGKAAVVESDGWARAAGACAAVATVLPTVAVAITGEQAFGTVTGGVVGLVVFGIAVAASATTGLRSVTAVALTGLVLAAPVVMLVLIHDAPAGATGFAWPLALAGVLVGAVGALRTWSTAALVALAVLPFIGMALRPDERGVAEFVVWALLFLVMAAVAASAGLAFRVVGTPAFAALATASALGVFGTLNLWRAAVTEDDGGVGASLGTAGHWVSALLLVCAVALVLVVGRPDPGPDQGVPQAAGTT